MHVLARACTALAEADVGLRAELVARAAMPEVALGRAALRESPALDALHSICLELDEVLLVVEQVDVVAATSRHRVVVSGARW